MNQQKGKISMSISIIITILFIGLVVYAFSRNKAQAPSLNQDIVIDSQLSETEETVDTKSPENVIPKNNKPMEEVAKNGDVLSMNYTGKLTNGTVFDSNIDPKFNHVEPFEFKLGAGMVIKGWDEGLVGMKVGEKKTLTITPDKGYGDRAVGPIPPNSTLIFDVELVAIKK
jgi:FKBP-type peptidyl-prolyl cis-trans isomerase